MSAIDQARRRFQELLRREYLTPDELEEVVLLTTYIAEYIAFTEAHHATTTEHPA